MAISTLLYGALAGFLATVPMSAAMQCMYQFLPQHERYPLPPGEITSEVSEKTGIEEHMDEEQLAASTVLLHFAYGAAIGVLYAPLATRLRLPSIPSGIAFGLVVWCGSYLGWLPAMGILRPASEHPARRNMLMIIAHIIWGVCTGALVAYFQRHRLDST